MNKDQIYIGSTNDLRRRLSEHNSGKEISTRRYMPWILIGYEAYRTESLARLREKRLKHNGNALRELKKRIGLIDSKNFKSGDFDKGGLPRATFLNPKSGAGFSLMGVIIATFIVSVSLVGILTLTSSSLEGSSLGKTKLIASGLAQEGIEVIRDMRKTEADWADWYSSIFDGDYRLQYDSASLLVFVEMPLKFDTNNSLYQYDTGNDSPFYRKITLTKVSDNEVKVVVEIKWQDRTTWRYLTLEDKLWNWR